MDLKFISNCPLFLRLDEAELESVLTCLGARERAYARDETLFLEGDRVESIGIVLSGSVQVSRMDFQGNREIITVVKPGELFCESFVCAGTVESPVAAAAQEPCAVLWIRFQNILSTCPSACPFHRRLVENMLRILARKNHILREKMECLSGRSIRDKVTAYLWQEVKKQGARQLLLPFTREELADYLCVDRSALSRELGRMRDEGIIKVNNRRVTIC